MINGLTLFSKKMIHDNRGKSCKFAAKKMGNIDIDELYLSYSKKNVIRGIFRMSRMRKEKPCQ